MYNTIEQGPEWYNINYNLSRNNQTNEPSMDIYGALLLFLYNRTVHVLSGPKVYMFMYKVCVLKDIPDSLVRQFFGGSE